jgi:hypothetical protein
MTERPDRHGPFDRPAGAPGATPGAAAPGFGRAGSLRGSTVVPLTSPVSIVGGLVAASGGYAVARLFR